MKVVFVVPSYPSIRCGVSIFSGYLAQELKTMTDVEILGAASSQSPLSLLKNVAAAAGHADVVHVQHSFDLYGYMGYLTFPLYHILHRTGKQIVTSIHELPDAKPKSLKDRLVSPYLRRCMTEIVQNSDAVIIHAEASRELLVRWRLLKSIHLIPLGTIQPKKASVSGASSRKGHTVGFFGFIREKKGVHRLLDALVRLPDTRLIVAGEPKTHMDQDYYANLKSKAATLGISDRVDFVGFLKDSALADFFQSVDVVVLPYSSCTASGAIQVCLAHRSVVLTSNLPVFHELKLQYDCLEEFDLREPETLAKQLKMLFLDTARRSELIAGCERMLRDRSWPQVAKKTYSLYESLLEKPSNVTSMPGKNTGEEGPA